MARVLLIDDDATVRYALKQVLERAGHQVDEANDGNVGLDKYNADHQDVVVTDIIMPNQEGIETIQALRELRPTVRIIAMSGVFGGQFLQTAERLGADATLAKPIQVRLLRDTVDDLLGRQLPRA